MEQQIEVPADWGAVAALMAFSDAAEAALALDAEQAYLLRLVVEEIATNIVKYGYADGAPGPIQLACARDGGALAIRIRDRGRPFSPHDHPDPDLSSADPAEREVGGLGLFFVREYADTLSYHHDPASGWNELTVTRGPAMIDLLRDSPLFRGVPPATLAAMAARLAERHLGAGEVLFNQGEVGYDCFVILAGAMEVITFVNGAELRLEVFHTGQIIGEMGLIDRSPRSATVRAVAPSRLVMLSEADFTELLGANPALALTMLRSSTTRVRNTNLRMIGDLEQKNAELLAAYQQLQAAQAELIRLSRIEEELSVARRIQQSFLPRTLPQPAGWQVAGYSRGAQAVGGDFFDTIELADGRLGLVVADACGKGVTAALFVALARSLLRAASQAPAIFQGGRALDSEAVLTGAMVLTNDYICREHGDDSMFVTLFYGLLDPQTGELAYVNAGHNPPLLVSPDGQTIVELAEGSLPIGIVADQRYEVQRASVAPGGRLVAFSDGITEAMDAAGEPFGDPALHAALRACPALGAQELVDELVARVDAYAAGAPQADDMTLLIACRPGGAVL